MFYNGKHDVDNFKRAVKRTVDALKKIEFDTVVFRGFSGATVGSVVAYELGKEWALVRKSGDSTHSSRVLEGHVGGTYVIVDDFIDSGRTVDEIVNSISRNSPYSRCLGVYLYDEKWCGACKNEGSREYFRNKLKEVRILNWEN